MAKRIRLVDAEERYNVETARVTLAACEFDLDREEERMRNLDAKLTQLATFSGVSITISGGLGANVLAGGRLPDGFLIALGSCVGLAGVLLLCAVVTAFRALAPKKYLGADESALLERTTPNALKRHPDHVLASIAATRREVLFAARKINDRKARLTARVFFMVGLAFAALVCGLIVTAVASVV